MLRSKKSPLKGEVTRAAKYTPYSKKYSNPYFQKKKKKNYRTYLPKFSLRFKLLILSVIILIFISIFILFFSRLFTINNIEVTILRTPAENLPQELQINSDEIKDIARRHTSSKLIKIIPQTNLFLFSNDALTNKIKDRYSYENLTINKKPLNTLSIIVEEKEYALIWRELEKYYYSDINGRIIAEANPLEINKRQYPLIDNQGENKIINDQVATVNLNFILNIFAKTKTDLKNYNIERFIVEDNESMVKMAIEQGPEIYFSNKEDLDKQINKLTVLINEKLKDDFLGKTYIDLRYGDRIYYR